MKRGKGALERKAKENDNNFVVAGSNEQKRGKGSRGGKKMDVDMLTRWKRIGSSPKINDNGL
jgi:hypothetical protein